MNHQPTDPVAVAVPRPDTWLDRAAKGAAIGGVLLLLTAASWTAVSGTVGGFMPGIQVRIDQLTHSIGSLQSAVQRLQAEIAAQPRPSDYVLQGQRIDHVDSRLDALDAHRVQDEIEAAAVQARVSRLESGAPPIRLPR